MMSEIKTLFSLSADAVDSLEFRHSGFFIYYQRSV